MGRKKIQIAYINNEKIRRSTFLKRKLGVFKKVIELNKLTGAKVWLKIYDTREQHIEEYCSEGDRALFDNNQNFDQKIVPQNNDDRSQQIVVEEFRNFQNGCANQGMGNQNELEFKEALKRKVDSLNMSQLMTLANPLESHNLPQIQNLNTAKPQFLQSDFQMISQDDCQEQKLIGRKRQRTEVSQDAWPTLRSTQRIAYVQKQFSNDFEQISDLKTPQFPSEKSVSDSDNDLESEESVINDPYLHFLQTRKLQQELTENKRHDKLKRKCMVSINLDDGKTQFETVQTKESSSSVAEKSKQDLIGQIQLASNEMNQRKAEGPSYPLRQLMFPSQPRTLQLRLNAPQLVNQNLQQVDQRLKAPQINSMIQEQKLFDKNQTCQQIQWLPVKMNGKNFVSRVLIKSDSGPKFIGQLPQAKAGVNPPYIVRSNQQRFNHMRPSLVRSGINVPSGSFKMPAVPQGKTTPNAVRSILMQPQKMKQVFSLKDLSKMEQ